MAKTSTTASEIQRLRAENKRLNAENKQLRKKVTTPSSITLSGFFRSTAIIICAGLAIALLIVGNLVFWTGNTIVKQDKFVQATSPIIQNPEVQSALATNISTQLFEQVDIETITKDALPPRADFLAPTLSNQIKQQTHATILRILERPQFQERWNTSLGEAHKQFITVVKNHGEDGSLDISEVYSDASKQLEGTNLEFLANKQLPEKVGNIPVVQGTWMSTLHYTIQNIDTWRILIILLFAAVSALTIWLSRNRRKMAIILALFFAASMFASLVALRIGKEVVAGYEMPQNTEAVRQIYTIFTQGLATQTWLIFAVSVVMLIVIWVSGPYRSSIFARQKIEQLFSGKLHLALFGSTENSFTLWLGKYKRPLEWLVILGSASSVLFIPLSTTVLLFQIGISVLLILLIEVLAARDISNKRKK